MQCRAIPVLIFNYCVSNLFSSCERAGESFGESFPLTRSLSLLMYLAIHHLIIESVTRKTEF